METWQAFRLQCPDAEILAVDLVCAYALDLLPVAVAAYLMLVSCRMPVCNHLLSREYATIGADAETRLEHLLGRLVRSVERLLFPTSVTTS